MSIFQSESAGMHAAAPFIQTAGSLSDLTLTMNELVLVETFVTTAQL